MKDMKKFVIALLVAVIACAGAKAEEWEKQFVINDSIYSAKLGVFRDYTVVLPASYYTQTDKTYPVLYLLHGMYDDNHSWEKKGLVRAVAHNLARSGEAREMIIVTPNAGGHDPKVQQNGYFNIPGWPYEDFFFEELIPAIEHKFRARKGRENRAISGLSMGGGGCTSYAQRHPDMFSAAYAMSALMDAEMPDSAKTKPGDKVAMLMTSVAENSCINYVKNADDATKDALRTVAWFVDCGDDDFLLDQNIAFYQAMREARIPCQLRVRDGMHEWIYWNTALYTALPFVSRHFAPEVPAK